jgi:hypothetical protein
MNIDWTQLERMTGTLVNVTIIIGALVAVIKLRLYNLLERRFRSEVQCSHAQLSDGRILFCGDYIVQNTGERQIWIEDVHLKLLGSKLTSDNLVIQNENVVLAARSLPRGHESYKGLHRLEAGERSIFPLRCIVNDLDEISFFVCKIMWPYTRTPSPYISLYVKSQGQHVIPKESSTQGTG